jgi:hypothetical protein
VSYERVGKGDSSTLHAHRHVHDWRLHTAKLGKV